MSPAGDQHRAAQRVQPRQQKPGRSPEGASGIKMRTPSMILLSCRAFATFGRGGGNAPVFRSVAGCACYKRSSTDPIDHPQHEQLMCRARGARTRASRSPSSGCANRKSYHQYVNSALQPARISCALWPRGYSSAPCAKTFLAFSGAIVGRKNPHAGRQVYDGRTGFAARHRQTASPSPRPTIRPANSRPRCIELASNPAGHGPFAPMRWKCRVEAIASKTASQPIQQVASITSSHNTTNSRGERSGEIRMPTSIVGTATRQQRMACVRRRNCW